MRFVRLSSAARRLWVAAVVLLFSSSARADIDAWYELTASTGPVGTGVVSVQQGTAGQQLIITTDSGPGTYQFTIKLLCDVDEVDALYAYSVDLLAPTATNVAVTGLEYLALMDIDEPILLGAGPGVLIDDATQLTFFTPQSGPLELLQFTMTVELPQTGDVEIYSGIGAYAWGPSSGEVVGIRFGDADPLASDTPDLVTHRPSIIIRQATPPPPPPVDPPPPVEPPPTDPPPTDPPPMEPPPVNPVPQDVTPSAETLTATQEQQNDIQPVKVVNRADLRKSLAMLFNVPVDGVEPMNTLPARVFGYIGMNLSILWGLSDLAASPWRMMAFEVTYAILDRWLP